MEKTASRVLSFLNDRREEMVEYLKSLVEIESPSLDPHTQPPVLERLAVPLRAIDYKVCLLRGRLSGGQLFASPAKRIKGIPAQLLLGHCDTVWPVGTLKTMPLQIKDGRMAGPGVYDMKAGLTQIVYALLCLNELGLVPGVTPCVYVTSDEELASEDSRFRLQLMARRFNRVLVPEPSAEPDGRLKTSRKGVGLFEIEVEGRSAHAGVEPEAGVSAVLEMAYLIQRLHELNDPARGNTVTVGVVEGGTRSNIVPARARALVDVRTQTAREGATIEDAIRGLKSTLEGTTIRVNGGMDRPPMEATRRNQELWEIAREMGLFLGLDLKQAHSGGGSDGNLTSPLTATLDGLGPVGGGAHAPHEFIYLDSLVERTALMTLILLAPPVSQDASLQ
ncbi:MAG: M20 family metallopeptidase [Acidobacteriota bacterium]|nr:MAG: M20 family metallopeptidase [Acidobacteriota bacterium]